MHPTQNGPFRDVETKHPQLTVNAGRAPGAILRDHAEDQFPQFNARRLPSNYGMFAREPFQIQLESGAMQADDSLWLDNNKCASPPGPESPQQDPENSI